VLLLELPRKTLAMIKRQLADLALVWCQP